MATRGALVADDRLVNDGEFGDALLAYIGQIRSSIELLESCVRVRQRTNSRRELVEALKGVEARA